MTIEVHKRLPLSIAGLILALLLSGVPSHSQLIDQDSLGMGLQDLPNMGQQITPLAPQGSRFVPLNPDLADNPDWLAGQAVTTVVSPDQKTLLVLTSGYNRVFNPDGADAGQIDWPDSNEYVFIYDISTPTPVKKQVVKIPNTYNGIVFDPSGTAFYVSGGADDNVHIFTRSAGGTWGEQSRKSVARLGPLPRAMALTVPPDPA